MPRFGAQRPQQIRETLPIVIIICDDTKTGPAYFAELRSQVRQKCTIRVVSAPRHGATGSTVVDSACDERRRLSARRGATVWAVIDLEMAHNSTSVARNLLKQAKRDKIRLALSQPCFEVWTLAHFIDTGARFDNCDAVLREVKKRWKAAFGHEFSQKKAQADYGKLIDAIDAAVRHSKPRNASNSQSWTDIWQIAERVLHATRS